MDTLEPSQGLSSLGLIACVAYLTFTGETSLVLERPTSAWVIILSACSCVLLLSDKIQLFFSRFGHQGQQYSAIPLEDISRDGHALSPPVTGRSPFSPPPSTSKQWLHRGYVALLLVVRIEILRAVGGKASTATLETSVPIFAALSEWWQKLFRQDHPRGQATNHSGNYQSAFFKAFFRYNISAVIYTGILSWFAALAISYSPSSLRSTYITFDHRLDSFPTTTPLQIVGIACDAALIIYLTMYPDKYFTPQSHGKNGSTFSLGISGAISAATCLVLGVTRNVLESVRGTDSGFNEPGNFAFRVLKLAFAASLLTLFVLCTLPRSGVLDASLLILCTVAAVSLFRKTWNQPTPFLDAHELKSLIPLGLFVGVALHVVAKLAREWLSGVQPNPDGPRIKRRWSLFHLFGVVFILQTLFSSWGHVELRDHQIDSLIHEAKRRHNTWQKAASSSKTLAEAARNYLVRYHQAPPPHFDKWFEYATERSSLIIDDFDTIHENLAPFWSLSPAEIRHRTKETLLAPTGGIGGIKIRDGIASITGNTPGTHVWELNGIIDMVAKFARFLPDMDLAFNLNDESRVAIPYAEIQRIQKAQDIRDHTIGSKLVNDFSPGRADGWTVEPEEHLDSNRFVILSFQNTWDFSSSHCPPGSLARSERYMDPTAFCASCAMPHSSDLFLANWTLAADVCYQPDLAHLHGFYISPAAFDATPHLMPIFSQSKAGGFKDILYPSPWNYLDKAKYEPNDQFPDPNFDLKKRALFWRGATTEAFSKTGTGAWKGMSRERVVNLLSNDAPSQALLLPDPKKHDANGLHLRYSLIDSSTLRESMETDVQFTEIIRCDGPECDEEASHFRLGSRKDFQEHWGYKYLLDLDGAGFSGRFLPFLFSKSLPFKMTLFREWWEGRLTPWVHFVPLDLRGQGVWATLAYFAGFEGRVGGDNVRWPPRDPQAKAIAEEGASWAQKVLRKEDMEIYMFRLLLEWGRLTDDRRSEIGYTVDP